MNWLIESESNNEWMWEDDFEVDEQGEVIRNDDFLTEEEYDDCFEKKQKKKGTTRLGQRGFSKLDFTAYSTFSSDHFVQVRSASGLPAPPQLQLLPLALQRPEGEEVAARELPRPPRPPARPRSLVQKTLTSTRTRTSPPIWKILLQRIPSLRSRSPQVNTDQHQP